MMDKHRGIRTAAATAERRQLAETRRRARAAMVRAGMTPDEIATVMGTSPGAVKQALARDMRNSGSETPQVDEDGLVWAS
ncbi:hypothetical protein C1N80_09000 [Brachybacterium sp. SGAir0954]|nr:hypothetical protein C1N80_09000 [Brachybacterium sp. SGAir0954]